MAFRKAWKKRFSSVLLTGTEEYLLRETLEEYCKTLIGPEARDFDFGEYRGDEISGGDLWNVLMTMPLCGDIRVVVLEDPSSLEKEAAGILERYLAQPAPSTVLILVHVTQDARARIPNEWQEVEVTVGFPILRESERLNWAMRYVESREKQLDPEAAQYLVETTGTFLAELAARLDHAILYVGQEDGITTQDLLSVGGIRTQYTLFNLEDAVLKGDERQAVGIARSLLEGGTHILQLLSFFRKWIIKIWKVSYIKGRTKDDPEVKKILINQSFKILNYKTLANRVGKADLRKAVLDLLDIEVREKSTTVTTKHRFYNWLRFLCNSAQDRREPHLNTTS